MRTAIALAAAATAAGTVLSLPDPATAVAPPTAPAAEAGWVEGVAVDGAGRPVAGALVNVLRAREVPETGLVPDRTDRRTWTGPDGAFRVRQGAGGYLVQVCQPDPEVRTTCRETAQGVDYVITYVGGSGTTDSWVLQQSLLPASPATRDLGRVTVQPKARLAGTLTGAPKGEAVRLMRLNDTVAFTTWTDAAGRYALDGLVPGRYYVAAGGAGRLPWSSAVVDLRAGTETRVDGHLERGAAILGRLRGPDGPVTRTELLVTQRGHGPVASAVTDRAGRFEITGLRAGRYDVRLDPGTAWAPVTRTLRITTGEQTLRPTLRTRRGAAVSVELVDGATAELRDRTGTPLVVTAAEDGRASFTGLAKGRYTLVAAGRKGYGARTLTVGASGTTRLGELALDRPFLTLTGRTAPKAVVEATTGDLCPPDGSHRFGAFHEIVSADARGRYEIDGLVPGRYMLGADDWPRTHAPRCWSGVRVRADREVDLPLQKGVRATGRLVYAGTTLPVVTSLSYELFHKPGSTTNPTEEHPARAKTVGATGRFTIERLTPGARTEGRLAREAGDGITDLRFGVVFPFQDGTPYWLDTETRAIGVPARGTIDLGDVAVTTYGR
jgi:protocatechuate 3,4-dioxygenase beta subunit